MKFSIERSHLLKPLQQVSGALGGRPALPILGNLLLKVEGNMLSMTQRIWKSNLLVVWL